MSGGAGLHPTVAALDLEAVMRAALAQAEAAGLAGERPIGAVAVVSGEIVSRSHARSRALKTQLLHAELRALLHYVTTGRMPPGDETGNGSAGAAGDGDGGGGAT